MKRLKGTLKKLKQKAKQFEEDGEKDTSFDDIEKKIDEIIERDSKRGGPSNLWLG